VKGLNIMINSYNFCSLCRNNPFCFDQEINQSAHANFNRVLGNKNASLHVKRTHRNTTGLRN